MPTGGLVAIFAHPDDETFGIGGTMAHYAARGVPVTMVCATRGEAGEIAPGTDATPETLGEHRERELRDAMAVLGVHDVRFLDFRDSGMQGTPENEDARNLMNAPAEKVVDPLVEILRERRPDAVATWDASGGYGHPDHIATHHHATAAFNASGIDARLFQIAIPMDEWGRMMAAMRDAGIDAPDFVSDEELASLPRVAPNCVMDVSRYFDLKMQAMLAHRTQITPDDPFMRAPEDLRRRFFGREHFFRAHPLVSNGAVLDDLFAP